LLSFIKTAIVT